MIKQNVKRIAILLVVCALLLTGCGAKEYTAADLVGAWETDGTFTNEVVTFSADGTFRSDVESTVGQFNLSGTYTVSDGKLTMVYDKTAEVFVYDFTFKNDDVMIWKAFDCEYVYTKK